MELSTQAFLANVRNPLCNARTSCTDLQVRQSVAVSFQSQAGFGGIRGSACQSRIQNAGLKSVNFPIQGLQGLQFGVTRKVRSSFIRRELKDVAFKWCNLHSKAACGYGCLRSTLGSDTLTSAEPYSHEALMLRVRPDPLELTHRIKPTPRLLE